MKRYYSAAELNTLIQEGIDPHGRFIKTERRFGRETYKEGKIKEFVQLVELEIDANGKTKKNIAKVEVNENSSTIEDFIENYENFRVKGFLNAKGANNGDDVACARVFFNELKNNKLKKALLEKVANKYKENFITLKNQIEKEKAKAVKPFDDEIAYYKSWCDNCIAELETMKNNLTKENPLKKLSKKLPWFNFLKSNKKSEPGQEKNQ